MGAAAAAVTTAADFFLLLFILSFMVDFHSRAVLVVLERKDELLFLLACVCVHVLQS